MNTALSAGLALACSVAFLGCGGGDAARFVGTYDYPAGATIALDCGGMVANQPVTGTTETIALGTSSDLVKTDSNNCALRFTVAGNVATAASGQSCVVTTPQGRTTVSTTSYVLTRRDNGTVDTAFTGTSAVDGAPGSCTLTLAATLTRRP